MRITGLKVQNFQGLKGVNEFDFGKITALAQPNGSGKTSLINALRWGLTGIEPSGQMIHQGEEAVAVRVVFESGSSFLRRKFAAKGKSAQYYVGNALTTLTKMNEFITHELGGIDISTAKTISTGELLASMNSQQFGELLLRYLPESMTIKTILDRFNSATDEQREVITEFFGSSEFGVEKLGEFHSFVSERRKLIRQKLEAQEAILSSLGSEAPEFSKEQLQERNQELLKERDEIVGIQAAINQYNLIYQQIQQRDKMLEIVANELEVLKARLGAESEEEKLFNEQIDSLMKQLDSVKGVMRTFAGIKQAISDALAMLESSNPDVSNNLETASEDILKMYEVQKNLYIEVGNQINALKQRKEDAKVRLSKAIESEILAKAKQKEDLMAQKLELPPKPTESTSSLQEINQKLDHLQRMMVVVENYSQRDNLLASIDKLRIRYSNYDGLVLAFSPKGEIKESITSYYLDEFSAPCNEKASKIFPGMSLKFVSDRGVKVLTDPDGSGEYLEFSSLSGGEQASVTFLLISMLSSLSGMGIIILDELSVLDDNVFRNLVRVLKENEDEYDMCLLAAVDHVDTLKTLAENNIPIISVGDKKARSVEESKQDEVAVVVEESSDNDAEDSSAVVFESFVEDVESEEEKKKPLSQEDVKADDKASQLSDLKDLVAKTMKETADLRFVDDGTTPETEEVGEQLKELGLSKGKSKVILDFIIENSNNEGRYEGTAKDISDALGISQPTVGKTLKVMQENDLITSLKRGVWKLSESLGE